jgi:hypothetical protein
MTDLERKTAAAWDHIRQSGSAFLSQHARRLRAHGRRARLPRHHGRRARGDVPGRAVRRSGQEDYEDPRETERAYLTHARITSWANMPDEVAHGLPPWQASLQNVQIAARGDSRNEALEHAAAQLEAMAAEIRKHKLVCLL